MIQSQKAILIFTLLVTNTFTHNCFKESKYGDTKGLQLLEGLTLNYIDYEEAKKHINITTADKKKYFLFHVQDKRISILSESFDAERQETVDLFFNELEEDDMAERKAEMEKVIPYRYSCLRYKFFSESFYSVGGYTYGVSKIFGETKNKHYIGLAIQLRKMGEVLLGMLYNIEIINNSKHGIRDLPSIVPIEVDDIGISVISTKRGFLEFNPSNVVFRYQRSFIKYNKVVFQNQLKEFRIFENMQNPDEKKIKCLNYFQLYYFWKNQMEIFFSYSKFDYNNCFDKRTTNDPTALVKCPTFFLLILDNLNIEEFILLKNLSVNIFEFDSELYKQTLFKVFMLMINLKSIIERRHTEEKLVYKNKKMTAKGEFNPMEEAFDNLFDTINEMEANEDTFIDIGKKRVSLAVAKNSIATESQVSLKQTRTSQEPNNKDGKRKKKIVL